MNVPNFNHLHYFWVVATLGSISAAARQLHVSQPTISAQIKTLEQSLGVELFRRQGRGLALTDQGRLVFDYAKRIFLLGQELERSVRAGFDGPRAVLTVGVMDVLPKHWVYQVLAPILRSDSSIRLCCYEGKLESLLSDLANHRVDVVLTDSPLYHDLPVVAHSHFLGECGLVAMASRRGTGNEGPVPPGPLESDRLGLTAATGRALSPAPFLSTLGTTAAGDEPKTGRPGGEGAVADRTDTGGTGEVDPLSDAAVAQRVRHASLLLPTPNTAVRRLLNRWFDRHEIHPRIVGEFEDSSLIKVFAQQGLGVCFMPEVLADFLGQVYGLERWGNIDAGQARFFAITTDRVVQHPSVIELTRIARSRFGGTVTQESPETWASDPLPSASGSLDGAE